MTASPSRGLLYPTLPNYDVFAVPLSKTPAEADEETATTAEETATTAEETATTAGESGTPAPTMARANWTGIVPADD